MENRAELDREDERDKDLVRPPDVHREPNRSATTLELFFDLAFLIFAEGVGNLRKGRTSGSKG